MKKQDTETIRERMYQKPNRIKGWRSVQKSSSETSAYSEASCHIMLCAVQAYNKQPHQSRNDHLPAKIILSLCVCFYLDFSWQENVPNLAEWLKNMNFELGIHEVKYLLQIFYSYWMRVSFSFSAPLAFFSIDRWGNIYSLCF